MRNTMKHITTVILILIGGLLNGVCIPSAEAAPVLFEGNGHYYEFIQVTDPFVGVNNSWATASAAASASTYNGLAGHLATVTSQEENDFLLGLVSGLGFTGFEGAWLGGKSPEGWLVGPESGQPFGYTYWNDGSVGGVDPNNDGYAWMHIGTEGDYSFSHCVPGRWIDDDSGSSGIPDPMGDPVIGYFVEYEASDTGGGLVGYWPFNGNANDESGYDNHGSVSGAVLISDRSSNPDSAYMFDGVDDFISVTSSNSLVSQDALTIAAWVNTNNVTFGYDGCQTIVSKGATYRSLYADFNLVLGKLGGQGLQWESSSGGNSPSYVSTTYTFFPDTWYHVAATYSAGTVILYINGASETMGAVSNDMLRSSDQPLYIGTRYLHTQDNQHTPFFGKIDEVRIYNRALSAIEIAQLAGHTTEDRELTVTKTGAGTVTSNPVGVDCGDVCTKSFVDGTVITLTATPSSTSSFTGWTGCTPINTTQCTVTMDGDKTTVTATFKSLADINDDGTVNSIDFNLFKNAYITKSPAADLNNDGVVNSIDFNLFKNAYIAR